MASLGKLVPSHPMHAEMLEKAPDWLAALRLSDLGIDADTLRIGIGSAELALGLLIIVIPAAGYGLTAIMGGALATHFIMDGNQVTADMIPAAFLSLLLGIHALLYAAISTSKKAELQAQTPRKDD